MKRLLLILLVLIITPGVAGGKKNAGKKTRDTVMIFGDSLSMSHGVPYRQGWVFILQKTLQKANPGWNIVNASIGGDTTRSGVSRLPRAMKKHRPAVVVLELGGNDGLRGLSLQQTRDNLDRMVDMIRKNCSRVLLVGIKLPPNYGPAYNRAFHGIYHSLASKYKVRLLPFLLEGIAGSKKLMQDDGIHPNTRAQPMISRNVWKFLQPLVRSVKLLPDHPCRAVRLPIPGK